MSASAELLAPPAAYGPGGRSPWLDVDWRSHQRWVPVEGRPVNTIELGEGPPLVFVHGLSGTWMNWLEQLPVLAGERRVVALDLPGFGRSPMPARPISISGYARLLDRLCDELGLGATAFVGNSMGGCIAAQLALDFPERVERIALVSPAGVSTHAPAGSARMIAALRRLERPVVASAAWVATHAEAVARRPRLREATLGGVVRHPGLLPAPLAAEQLRGAGRPGFLTALQAVFDCDLRPLLPEVACPTLIAWGARDRLISAADAAVFAELVPGARKVVLTDTGHMAMLERPAVFNALLREFLAA